jgi:hypothetical protein
MARNAGSTQPLLKAELGNGGYRVVLHRWFASAEGWEGPPDSRFRAEGVLTLV